MTQDAKEAYDRAKETKPVKAVRNFADELIDKTVGINKEDRQFIRENKDLVNDYASKKKNIDTLYDKVKNKLDEKILEKIET